MAVLKAKITSKGQITVPKEVRRRLGVGPGDKILFEQDKSGFRMKPDRSEGVFERFRGIGNPGIGPGRKGIIRWTREMRGR